MKSILVTLLLSLALCGAATAQKQDRHAELPGTTGAIATRASLLTRNMCNELRLNEAQYIRLRAVNYTKLTKLEEIAWLYKDDAAEQSNRTGELEAQYEAECSRILTPSQLSLLHDEQQHDVIPALSDPKENGVG